MKKNSPNHITRQKSNIENNNTVEQTILLVGLAKVKKVQIFPRLYYIIKRIPTLVSGALEPV